DQDFPPAHGRGLPRGGPVGDRLAARRIGPRHGGTALAARGINVVINRTAAAKLGYRAPAAAIGNVMQVAFDGFVMVPSTIVGVVEDTRFGSLREAAEPIVYAYDPEHASEAVVRFTAARPAEIMGAVGKL